MLKVCNVTKFNDWEEIKDIVFMFNDGDYQSHRCQNLMAFDIETSNGFRQPDGTVLGFNHELYNSDEEYRKKIDNGEAMSVMYIWQIAIENQGVPMVFCGRTWDEWLDFMDQLTTEIRRQAIYGFECTNRFMENLYAYNTKDNVYAECYIHNEGFEFQHLRNVWEDEFTGKTRAKHANVFARTSRKPMKFKINTNKVHFEFRDSLVLTQKSLHAWCEDEKLPVQKLDEPKDYYLPIRTPKTQLTDEELLYSINDVVSMLYGLEKYRSKYEALENIPLTQTGQVRIKCREKVCRVNREWAAKCAEITQSYTPDDFRDLCQLFQGGWTHANKMFVNKVLKNVRCFDFASSYPAVMTTRTYPIGKFEDCDISEFEELEAQDIHNAKYHWYAEIEVNDFVSSGDNSYWSLSKVSIEDNKPQIEGQVVDNGRLYYAKRAVIMVSDLDWDTFKQAYKIFGDIKVLKLRKSEAGYLPKELVLTILEYFKYKTSLKGDADNESLYTESKQFINSIYGCAVTKIITDLIQFDDGWKTIKCNDDIFYETISAAKEENTFLAYQQGIWVTSWARHNLWEFILKLDKHIAYCDTDSIKGLLTDEDLMFVEEYNKNIEKIENDVANKLGFDPTLYTAVTKKGKTKRLGIMEREDDCQEFKTLGAKRYVDLIDGQIHCTIAGLPKRAGEAKIKSVAEFNNHMKWNTRESEKLCAIYNDNQKNGLWTDRDGLQYVSYDKYGTCLKPVEFDLSMSGEFVKFLQVLATGKIDKTDSFFNDMPSYLMK